MTPPSPRLVTEDERLPAKDTSPGWKLTLRALADMVTQPRRGFDFVARHNACALALLVLAACQTISTAGTTPFAQAAMRAAAPVGLELNEATLAAGRWAAILASPFLLVLGVLVNAMLVWLLATALHGRCRFRQSLALVVHASLILQLKEAVALVMLRIRGLDAIRTLADLQTPLGLDALGLDGTATNVFLASINPFTIWFLALVAVGATVVLGLPKGKAWTLVAVHWAATTGFSAAIATLNQRLTATLGV